MNLLAIDTSTRVTTVALAINDSTRVWRNGDPSERHASTLIPMIQSLLQANHLAVGQLNAVAVNVGPGSFTGLRVGLMAAKTLAFAKKLPLLALNGDEILAESAETSANRVVVVYESRRGELTLSTFVRTERAWSRADAPTIVSAAEWLSQPQPETWVVGPALDRFPTALEGFAGSGPSHATGPALLRLALAQHQRGAVQDADSILPNYLRPSAAEEKAAAKSP
jgi:tRNA threonylcarbamoyladenosine biosynthesis protein TsaB